MDVDGGPGVPSESAVFASGQCLHVRWWKAGTVNRKQRRQCALCGISRLDGAHTRMVAALRALQVLPYLRKGLTYKVTAGILGVNLDTVYRAAKLIKRLKKEAL